MSLKYGIIMKRTELERRQRELRKAEKKAEVLERKSGRQKRNAGMYITEISGRFLYDQNEIFNASSDVEILELLENMKEDLPEKQWDTVLKKAINKTKVQQTDKALEELKELMGTAEEAAN